MAVAKIYLSTDTAKSGDQPETVGHSKDLTRVYRGDTLASSFFFTNALYSLSTFLRPFIRMKFRAALSMLACAVVTVFGQTIDIGKPTQGTVLSRGQSFTAQIDRPVSILQHELFVKYLPTHPLENSIMSCTEVGIALAITNCNNGVCPQPQDQLGNVLYAGPFTPTLQGPGQYYQKFKLQVPQYMSSGPAIFTLTHLCLLGVCCFLSHFGQMR